MKKSELLLMPMPKEVALRSGSLAIASKGFIVLKTETPDLLLPSADWLQWLLGENWQITAGPASAGAQQCILEIDPAVQHGTEAYELSITSNGIHVRAAAPAGIFYGVCTIAQLMWQGAKQLPLLSITDWPDFPARGVMLDISRDKVPTIETLFDLVELLSSWKINQVQLYTEHTFAYVGHDIVWKNASPITPEDVLRLDAFCKERFVELLPNQNSFGHMTRWLKHPQYKDLAECPDGSTLPWGKTRHPVSLNPQDPRSIALIDDLYGQLLPNFSSKRFNVGCDETFDLGMGRSKEACEKRGVGRVYLDFLLKIHGLVSKYGCQMQFWGDIVMKHPELIPELPKDLIALEWGYQAEHPFKADGEKFAQSGIEFWVCPGTSSWNSLSGRTDNAARNLENAAENGLATGATGFLNTDWGDGGHQQYLPVSYLGFLYGAGVSWNSAGTKRAMLPDALSAFAFRDRAGVMGKAAYDFGNSYLKIPKQIGNATIYNRVLIGGAGAEALEGVKPEEFDAAAAFAESAVKSMKKAKMDRPDAKLILDEFANGLAMVQAGCRLGKIRLEGDSAPAKDKAAIVKLLRKIIPEHDRLWLERNRPGGLKDSRARLEARLNELQG